MKTSVSSNYMLYAFAGLWWWQQTTFTRKTRIISWRLDFRNKSSCYVDMEAAILQKWFNIQKVFAYVSMWRKCELYAFIHISTIYTSEFLATLRHPLIQFIFLFLHTRVIVYMPLYTMMIYIYFPSFLNYMRRTIFVITTYAEAY